MTCYSDGCKLNNKYFKHDKFKEVLKKMKVLDTEFPGVKIIFFEKITDERGLIDITFDESVLEESGILFKCVQQRIYHAPKKSTFYGIHFQDSDHPQAKLVYCLEGKGIDYIVDLKKDSPTYKKWIKFEICADDNIHIYIPQGYGHGFLTLENDTKLLFSIDEYFGKGGSKKIRYDDKQINIDYPVEIEILSEGDKNAPFLD